MAKLCDGGVQFLFSRPAIRWRSNLSTTPGDPRQLAFGRLSYDAPVGADGSRIGASGYYSEVRPGDYRHLFNDNIKTELFEIRGSIVPLQSQRSGLTLTAAAGFTNATENDVFGPIYAGTASAP